MFLSITINKKRLLQNYKNTRKKLILRKCYRNIIRDIKGVILAKTTVVSKIAENLEEDKIFEQEDK